MITSKLSKDTAFSQLILYTKHVYSYTGQTMHCYDKYHTLNIQNQTDIEKLYCMWSLFIDIYVYVHIVVWASEASISHFDC